MLIAAQGQHPQSTTCLGACSPLNNHRAASLHYKPLVQASNTRLLEEVEALKAEVAGVTGDADLARWVLRPTQRGTDLEEAALCC